MKRNNKKGFTIVELVIVIAVIAILSAVLIPTFGGVTAKAQDTARDQEARNTYTQYLGNWDYENGEPVYDGYILVDEYYYEITDGNIDIENESKDAPASTYVENEDGIFVCNHVDNPEEGKTEGNGKCDGCGATMN